MKKVFVVTHGGKVSSEAYNSIEQAVKFVLGRADQPRPDKVSPLLFRSDGVKGSIYSIIPLSVR